jgi:DNA-binding SARP family transcriptional activator/tetratricopeptide (TPR) repeat protein
VQLCGRLGVELEGEQVEERLRGRQGRQLFAYLVVNRSRAVTRDELVDALWPFDPPPRPGAALSTQLSLLRAALGAARVEGRSEIQLVLPTDAWVDVEAASEAVGRAEAATARGDWQAAWSPAQAALAIAERGFMPGHDAPWIDVRRRDLEDLLVDALEIVATVGVRIGGSELGVAERAARRLIELAPMRESGHVALMQVQLARGNAAEGLRVYEELRRRLRDELGAVPGAAAQRVHMSLLGEGDEPEPEPSPAASEIPLPPLLATAPRLPFVGRRRDLARLELLLDRTGELPHQIALLAGEPGIGKTRLLLEFGRLAHERGALTLFGRADEARLVPYGPFLEAIRHHVAHAPAESLARAADTGQGELRALLPELRAAVGPVPASGGDPSLARYRLFDAISGLLVDAAAERPVVLLLDDLHWADEPTLLLLKHVLRAPQQRGLLVVGSYRDAELHRARALSETLADLQRDVPWQRVSLRGLARADVGALARESTGTEPDEALVASIHEETEGNPFFAIELARHLAEADPEQRAGLPDGVRDVILLRLAHLDEPSEQALRHAAVLGREFDLDVLERLGPVQGDALVDALDEAVAARVVTEVPDRPERYSFAHALIRATLYADLTGARRVRLHERAGDALLALREAGRPVSTGEIASHLLAALPRGDAGRALDQAALAAREATDLLRYEDAARQLTQPRRLALLMELGHAQRRSGRMPEARATFLDAIAIARELGDRRVLAEAVLGYGGGWFESAFMDETTVALLEEALAGVDGDSVLRLELLSRLAKALYYSEDERDEERRVQLSAEAIAMAERLGDDGALLVALEGRHFALTSPENLDERIATARRIIELAAEVGDRERDLLGRYFLIADLVEADQMDEADREIELYGRLAEEARLQLHRWYHARFLAMRALLAGRLDDAAALAQRAFELGQPVEPRTATMHFGTQTWLLHRIQGRLGELEEPVRMFVAEYPRVPAWRAGLAHVLLAQGRRDEAAEVFREFTESRFANVPRDAIWSLTMGLAADLVAAGLGTPEDARLLYELLAPYAERNAVTGEVIVCSGPMALYAGAMALVMGEPGRAIPLLESALERSERMGAKPFEDAAREALEQARALQQAA